MSKSTTISDFAFTFPPEPQWVRAARRAVRTVLVSVPTADNEAIELAALLTSELVTNAVAASYTGTPRSPITLHGEWAPAGTLRVLVHDQAPGSPLIPGSLPGPASEHGRGLLLVSLHATDWGVCHHIPGAGKIVWFTLVVKR